MSKEKENPAPAEEVQAAEAEAAPETGAGQPGRPSETAEALDAARAELAEARDKHLRLAAEYDNYRKRTQKERESLYADARASTAEKFLPVCDNLIRALAQPTQDTAFRKGVEMIKTGLDDILDKLGVAPIEAMGQPFDPALHEAVAHIQDDSGEENIVAEVFQTGFTLGDRVLRPAVVSVKN
jgi:molecular chaperone GrpE